MSLIKVPTNGNNLFTSLKAKMASVGFPVDGLSRRSTWKGLVIFWSLSPPGLLEEIPQIWTGVRGALATCCHEPDTLTDKKKEIATSGRYVWSIKPEGNPAGK